MVKDTIHHPHRDLADLHFHVDVGADEALNEVPVNRFEESTAAHAKIGRGGRKNPDPKSAETKPAEPAGSADGQKQIQTGATPIVATDGDGDAVTTAREQARSAETLEDLNTALAGFDQCPLKAGATHLVFGDGHPDARLMLVGEAPGREEDRTGVPFVGRSGQLLDRMLVAIGLSRADVYIANTIPWRPPNNRTPTPIETEMCRPFIERQIALVDPDILVLLGGAAAKQLLDTNEGILRLRGKWRPFQSGKREIRALATLHPAYLLRDPAQKRLAWRDFLVLKEALSNLN